MRLGEIMIDLNMITETELIQALKIQSEARSHQFLGCIMIDNDLIDHLSLFKAVITQRKIRYLSGGKT